MTPDPRQLHESTAFLTEGWHYSDSGLPWALVTREGDARVVYLWSGADPHPSHETLRRMFPLTPTQARVLRLLLTRRTNAEIAAQLGIGINTVRRHVEAVLLRLNIKSRWDAEACVLAAAAARKPPTVTWPEALLRRAS